MENESGKRERSVAGTQAVCLLDSALVLLNEGPGDETNVVTLSRTRPLSELRLDGVLA